MVVSSIQDKLSILKLDQSPYSVGDGVLYQLLKPVGAPEPIKTLREKHASIDPFLIPLTGFSHNGSPRFDAFDPVFSGQEHSSHPSHPVVFAPYIERRTSISKVDEVSYAVRGLNASNNKNALVVKAFSKAGPSPVPCAGGAEVGFKIEGHSSQPRVPSSFLAKRKFKGNFMGHYHENGLGIDGKNNRTVEGNVFLEFDASGSSILPGNFAYRSNQICTNGEIKPMYQSTSNYEAIQLENIDETDDAVFDCLISTNGDNNQMNSMSFVYVEPSKFAPKGLVVGAFIVHSEKASDTLDQYSPDPTLPESTALFHPTSLEIGLFIATPQ